MYLEECRMSSGFCGAENGYLFLVSELGICDQKIVGLVGSDELDAVDIAGYAVLDWNMTLCLLTASYAEPRVIDVD
jgi:hypothetical protein